MDDLLGRVDGSILDLGLVHPFAAAALLSFPLVVGAMFLLMPPRRAVASAFVFGFMFLPWAEFEIEGLPNYTKTSAIALGCLGGVALFDASALMRFRLSWLDLLPLVGVIGYTASSLGNGLGANDAISNSVDYSITYGIPFVLGRVYFGTPGSLRELAIAIVIGFVAYIPIMAFEFRMSAQLSKWIYGLLNTAGHSGLAFLRRPSGFFQHGLALSSFLGPLAALSVWLAVGRSWRGWWVLSAAAVATLACIFTCLASGRGSIVIMFVGAGAALLWRRTRRDWIPQVFAAAVIAYLVFGLGGGAIGVRQATVDVSEAVFGAAKSESLAFRFRHEAVLVERGWESPIYGLGGWGRNRISREEAVRILGHKTVVTDGLWVIIFSERGFLGLLSIWGWMLLPGMLAVQWVRKLPMATSQKAIVLGLATWSFLYAGDCLLNAFWTPIQPLVAGGLVTFAMLASKVAPGLRRDRSVAVTRAARPKPKPDTSIAGPSREAIIDLER